MSVKTFGIDAHVLTGKYQGSQTVLRAVLKEIGALDSSNRYIIYSNDARITRPLFDFPNFAHRTIPVRSSTLRLLFFWPYARLRDGLDVLVTQYNCAPLYPGKQAVVIHDILFETHPQFFPPAMRWRLRVMTRYSAWLATRVFVVSKYTRRQVIRCYGLPESKVVLTRNGFIRDLIPAADCPVPDGLGRYILFVGRLEPRKNLSCLLRAFDRLGGEGVNLVVVGDEDFRAHDIVEQMTSIANVIHLRGLPAKELAAVYRHASVFAYPTLAEGFGLPLLEALANGVPVVSSNTTALPEVGGGLVQYFDPLAADADARLAGLLKQALDQRRSPDPAAVSRHLERFDWGKTAARLVEQLEAMS